MDFAHIATSCTITVSCLFKVEARSDCVEALRTGRGTGTWNGDESLY